MGESISKFVWVFVEVVGDFFVSWVYVQCKVCSQYEWCVFFFWVVCIRYGVCVCVIFWLLLMGICWVFGQFLVVFEEVFEVFIVLLCWCVCLGIFQIGSDGVFIIIFVKCVFLIGVYFFDVCFCRFCVNVFFRIIGIVGFVKGVAISNQCYGFFVIYCYMAESFVDIVC